MQLETPGEHILETLENFLDAIASLDWGYENELVSQLD